MRMRQKRAGPVLCKKQNTKQGFWKGKEKTVKQAKDKPGKKLGKVKKEYKECEIYGCEKGNQTFCERPVQF